MSPNQALATCETGQKSFRFFLQPRSRAYGHYRRTPMFGAFLTRRLPLPPQPLLALRRVPMTCVASLMLFAGIAAAATHPSEQPDDRHQISGLWVLPSNQYMQPHNVPLTPAAEAAKEAQRKAMAAGKVLSDAGKKCLPAGMPGMMSNEFALEILESPGVVAILSEESSLPRIIHIDQTTPPDDLMPMWNGHAVGHWEGDTLVVQTDDFNDRIARTPSGGLPSTKLHLTEHMTLLDGGETLQEVLTFTDPVNLTKPFTQTFRYQRLPAGSELWEYPCEIDAAGWKDRFKGDT